MHATQGNFAMSDHVGENAALKDAGKGAAGSSDNTLTARMDLMLQSTQQMREEMKAEQEETSPQAWPVLVPP